MERRGCSWREGRRQWTGAVGVCTAALLLRTNSVGIGEGMAGSDKTIEGCQFCSVDCEVREERESFGYRVQNCRWDKRWLPAALGRDVA
jgi:hypothetical protein